MIRILLILLSIVVTSLMYFPFEFVAFPGLNTKKILAVIGLCICLCDLLRIRNTQIPRNLLYLSLWAGIVSLIGLFSVIYNNTPDYAYATYIFSMWVWLSAAYVVCSLLRWVHGYINIELLTHYLMVVCICQCFLALIIDSDPILKNWVNMFINQGQDYLVEVKRIYGIGASLDVAGTRFSACLILIVFLIQKNKERLSQFHFWCYITAYVIIAVVGNMIARTTTVGIIIGLIYLGYVFKPWKLSVMKSSIGIWRNILIISIILIPLGSYLYSTNEQFHKLFRFAFEGFFNYIEYGEWETASTGKLKTMYVFPDNLRTWIIGDGYFSNPHYSDPNYVGKTTKYGYYMGTDVGYLRFIFYFGIIGLLSFSAFMIYSAKICMKNLSQYKELFALLLISNFVIWFKVSTDIFLVFALFICVANLQDNKELDTLRK